MKERGIALNKRHRQGFPRCVEDMAVVLCSCYPNSLPVAVEANAARYLYLKQRVELVDHDGGWSGSFRFYPIPAYDHTPYSRSRGKGLYCKDVDAAIDAAISNS